MQIGIDSGTGEVYIPEPPPNPLAPEPPPVQEPVATHAPAPSAYAEQPVSNSGYQPTQNDYQSNQTNASVNNEVSESQTNQQTSNQSQPNSGNAQQNSESNSIAIAVKTGIDAAMNKVFFDYKIKTNLVTDTIEDSQNNELSATQKGLNVSIQGADQALKFAHNPPPNKENNGNWGLHCLGLVNQAFQSAGQTIPNLQKGTAYQSYQAYQSQGQIHTEGTPPGGAIVFFDWTANNNVRYGHIGISNGDGTFVGTTMNGNPPTTSAKIDGCGLKYLGWAYPDADKVTVKPQVATTGVTVSDYYSAAEQYIYSPNHHHLQSQQSSVNFDSFNNIKVNSLNSSNIESLTPLGSQLHQHLSGIDNAEKQLEKTNEKLALDLAKFDGVLTPKQQQEYIVAYRQKYADKYRDVETKTKNLVEFLDKNREALIKESASNAETAQKTFDALKAVSSNVSGVHPTEYNPDVGTIKLPSDAEKALKFTEEFLSQPQLKNSFFNGKAQEIQKEIGKPLVERIAAALTAETNGDSKTFIEEFKKTLEPYNSFKDMALGLQETGLGTSAWKNFVETLEKASLGKPLSEIADDWRARGFGGQVVVGLSLYMNVVGAMGTRNNPDELANFIKHEAQGYKDALSIYSGFTAKLIGEGGELARAGKLALSARFAEGLVPGLGLIANTAALISHGKTLDDPDVGLAISIVGDCIAVTAGVAQLIPVVGGLAAPVTAIGEALSGFGELVSLVIKGDENRLRQLELLEKVGVSTESAHIFSNSGVDRDKVAALEKKLGLSPSQLSRVAQKYPSLVLDLPGTKLDKLIEFANARGIEGQNLVDFLSSINQHQRVSDFLEIINGATQGEASSGDYFSSAKPMDNRQWKEALNKYAEAMDELAARPQSTSRALAETYANRAKMVRAAANFEPVYSNVGNKPLHSPI